MCWGEAICGAFEQGDAIKVSSTMQPVAPGFWVSTPPVPRSNSRIPFALVAR